jgi:hypothetical protein
VEDSKDIRGIPVAQTIEVGLYYHKILTGENSIILILWCIYSFHFLSNELELHPSKRNLQYHE